MEEQYLVPRAMIKGISGNKRTPRMRTEWDDFNTLSVDLPAAGSHIHEVILFEIYQRTWYYITQG
jgi:hypothetical protein